jgi:hypothetical protein
MLNNAIFKVDKIRSIYHQQLPNGVYEVRLEMDDDPYILSDNIEGRDYYDLALFNTEEEAEEFIARCGEAICS